MKKLSFIILVLFVFSFTFLFAGGQSEEKQDQVTMRVGDIENVNNLGAKALDKFGEELVNKSGGSIEFKAFHASQLGSATKQLEQVKSGAIEAYRGSLSWLSGFVPGFALIEFPYLVTSADEAKKVAKSDAMMKLNDKLADEHGLRFVTAGWVRLPRQLITKKPVESLEDLENMKIRVPEIFSYMEAFRSLGASPTPVAFDEAYLALRQGVVDGAENHVESLYNMKWFEVAKHLTITNHSYDITGFIVNDDWWQSLSEEHKTLIVDLYDEIDVWFKEKNEELQDEYISKMMDEAGIKVHEVDIDTFRNQVFPEAMMKGEESGIWEEGLFEGVMKVLE